MYFYYLTLMSVSSLYNSQNSEMKFCEKYEVEMLKIIIIITGYTLNNFTTHITISQQMMENYIISKLKTKFIFSHTHTHTQMRPHTQRRLVKSLPTNLFSSLVQSNLAISDKLILRISGGVQSQKVSTCIVKQVLVGVL